MTMHGNPKSHQVRQEPAPRLSLKSIHDIAAEQFKAHEGYDLEGVMPWVAATVNAATAPLLEALHEIQRAPNADSRSVVIARAAIAIARAQKDQP